MAAEVSTGEPTSEEILNAIDVLKRAGLNITAGSNVTADTSSTGEAHPEKQIPSSLVNPEYEAINMMMGNHNGNNDPMTTVLPYMLNNNENGKNIDPQMVQVIMMNSMMNSLNGLNTTDDK